MLEGTTRPGRVLSLDTACMMPRPVAAFGWAAQRPGFSALGRQQGILLPSTESGRQRYLADERVQAAPPLALRT